MNRTNKRISEYPFQPWPQQPAFSSAERFAVPLKHHNTLAGKAF
jgi:hypothetical protein